MTNPKPNGRSNGEAGGDGGKQQGQRTKSKSYPRYSMRRAVEFAREAFAQGPWRVDQDNIAQKVGYSNATNGAYKSLRATVSYFEMVRIETDGSLSVMDEWINVFESDDPATTRRACQAAMQRPTLYQQLIDEYKDSQLPTLEKLAQRLYLNPQKYGITKDAAEVAARAFLESASYANMIDDKRYLRLNIVGQGPLDSSQDDDQAGQTRAEDQSGRKGLYGLEQPGDSIGQPGSIPGGLVRQEVPLRRGKIGYLIVPRRLSVKDKERLKQYIDLILDEDEEDDNVYDEEV